MQFLIFSPLQKNSRINKDILLKLLVGTETFKCTVDGISFAGFAAYHSQISPWICTAADFGQVQSLDQEARQHALELAAEKKHPKSHLLIVKLLPQKEQSFPYLPLGSKPIQK